MFIQRISADWKDGTGGALELRDGLNIVKGQQPDWAGAMCTLLYGPDDESPERVDMECRAAGRTVTLSRDGGASRISVDADAVPNKEGIANGLHDLRGTGGGTGFAAGR